MGRAFKSAYKPYIGRIRDRGAAAVLAAYFAANSRLNGATNRGYDQSDASVFHQPCEGVQGAKQDTVIEGGGAKRPLVF